MLEKYQTYPNFLYRKTGGTLENLLVENEQEHEAAKLEGWGEHPSQLSEPKPEAEDTNEEEEPRRGPGRPRKVI